MLTGVLSKLTRHLWFHEEPIMSMGTFQCKKGSSYWEKGSLGY